MQEVIAPEVFCDRIQSVEVIGPCARIMLTAGPDRMPADERQPALYIVFPIERIPAALFYLSAWLAEHARSIMYEKVADLLH